MTPKTTDALREARDLLADCVARASTPDGQHPFLFDTMSLVQAQQVLSALEAALAAALAPNSEKEP